MQKDKVCLWYLGQVCKCVQSSFLSVLVLAHDKTPAAEGTSEPGNAELNPTLDIYQRSNYRESLMGKMKYIFWLLQLWHYLRFQSVDSLSARTLSWQFDVIEANVYLTTCHLKNLIPNMKKKVRSSEFMSFQFFPTATLQGSNSVYSLPSFAIARSEFSTRKESDSWIASIQQEVPGTEGMLRSCKQGWFSHCRVIQRLFCCLIEIIKTKFVVCILKSFEFSPLQWTSPFSQNWKQGGASVHFNILFACILLPSIKDCH